MLRGSVSLRIESDHLKELNFATWVAYVPGGLKFNGFSTMYSRYP